MTDVKADIERMGFDAVMAHNLSEVVRITRETAIEECAKVLDEASQDWRRIRDPGMANNAAAYARRIRALAQSNQEL